MQLVFHTGAHFTEEERLLKCLLRNKEELSARGVSVPGPGKYRRLLRQTMSALAESDAAENAREILLDAILDDETADRVLLSNAHFFGVPKTAVRKGLLYPSAPERLVYMANIFRDDQIELFMALRNPATFLPAAYETSPQDDLASFMGGVDPRAVRWSDTLLRIREAAPEIAITVWCNEDAPLIWSQIIREMAGFDHGEEIIGGFDLLHEIMLPEGMTRFREYMKSHPNMTEIQKRRVMVAFLDKFAMVEAIEEELDMPGWTDELVAEMTQTYDEDVFDIARIPGVQLLSP
ncbi:hypothetical protein KX928_23155 [Roseobacter sp. YSTF-M11]|uniref:Uncharacterized protein n=1 Tax=Roseobacter insulae TaxID=2859783 RepID=A0A9X1K2W6_9RHOB|nr:hypothetical protein [Roseobacter insulae]MBW4710699.1 hypothetical protein [Roseobacter insulae]